MSPLLTFEISDGGIDYTEYFEVEFFICILLDAVVVRHVGEIVQIKEHNTTLVCAEMEATFTGLRYVVITTTLLI